MKNILFGFIVLLSLAIIQGCGKSDENLLVKTLNVDSLVQKDSNLSLAEFIYKSGDFITKKDFPPLIHATDILYNKSNFLLIDIRSVSEYEKGHIEGSYNVDRKEILNFLKTKVNTAEYEKIVIIDDFGPTGVYVATLLRFMGYNNSFGLKFGIATWNKQFSENIAKNLSNKFASQIDTVGLARPKFGALPLLQQKPFMDLLNEQVKKNIERPDSQIFISADDVFKEPSKYFLLSYWTEAKFVKGHIPGSIRYDIRTDLSYSMNLKTLPINKKIVVYCNTGHQAIALIAYLRLLGYDAVSILYGANSFMNVDFTKNFEDAGITDVSTLTGDFALITGKGRTEEVNKNVKSEVKNTEIATKKK